MDINKFYDILRMSKDDFLASYSYLNENDYLKLLDFTNELLIIAKWVTNFKHFEQLVNINFNVQSSEQENKQKFSCIIKGDNELFKVSLDKNKNTISIKLLD